MNRTSESDTRQLIVDHNRESVVIWLRHYAADPSASLWRTTAASYSDDKQFVKKRAANTQTETDIDLIDRLRSPRVISSFAVCRSASSALRRNEPELFAVIEPVYFSEDPDVGAPERWRRVARQHTTPENTQRDMTKMLMLHDAAVDRLAESVSKTTVLDVPSPIRDETHTEANDRRRLIAVRTYFDELERTGDPALSRKTAAQTSGRSLRQVQRDTKEDA